MFLIAQSLIHLAIKNLGKEGISTMALKMQQDGSWKRQ